MVQDAFLEARSNSRLQDSGSEELPIRPSDSIYEDYNCRVCGEDVVIGAGEMEEDSDGEDVIHGQEEGVEAEKLRAERDTRQVEELTDPRRPSEAEVERHRRTHLPYRNWCVVCVKAKGRDLDHRADAGKERGLSEYS